MVACRSPIDSNKALCVRGEARLISSASRMSVKTGPGWKRNSCPRGSNTETPRMSDGRRSGVNCKNRKSGSHALRASLATALLSEGNDYHTIQKVLGHRDIESTKVYAKAEVEQLRTNALPVLAPTGAFASLLRDGGARA